MFLKRPMGLRSLLKLSGLVLGLILVGLLIAGWEPDNTMQSEVEFKGVGIGRTGVGIVTLEGVITESEPTVKIIREFNRSDRIKAIVFRVNSPGGGVVASQEIFEALKKCEKPVVVSMGDVAASGGLYVSMGAKYIMANPGTLTGSIGVIMNFVNLSGLYQWAKIERYVLKTGKFKGVGSDHERMSKEAEDLLKKTMFEIFGQFKEAVSTSRNIPMEKLNTFADGRVFSGSEALKLGIVDELGTFEDAILKAGELAGITGEPKRFYPKEPKPSLMEALFDQMENSSSVGGVLNFLKGAEKKTSTELRPGMYWIWHGA